MRYGMVVEELASDVMGELPEEARREVLELVERVRADPRAWPDVRDPGSVQEIREAFGRRWFVNCTLLNSVIFVRSGKELPVPTEKCSYAWTN